MRVLRGIVKAMLVALCIVCVGMTLLFAYPRYREYEKLRAEALELSARIDEERSAQEHIINEMENAMSDTQVERIARERLGFIKSNEIIFVNEND